MIGRTISHYRILERVGGGGMGVVYRAEDLKLRRTVALKFLAPELTRNEDAKHRFIHEAQAASALDHPNICSIFDIDETPEGQLFIAMACYEGESLKQRIERRKLDVSEAFEIAFSVGQGLARAHASGIIHRDIKPGNVMITSDGFVKVVDFGLAKLIGRSRVTGSGVTLGTVAYMAPEQTRGDDVDARADVWAVGALLYEMLTGKLPFRGEIDQAVVYSILNEEPTPIRELRPEVPEACVAVVMKCLEKDPDRRYQSMAELCAAFIELSDRLGWESFATGSVRAVSVVRRTGRRRRAMTARIVIGAALVVAVAGTLAWRMWGDRSVYSTKTRLAVMPLERPASVPPQTFVDGLSQWISEALDRASGDVPSMWVLSYNRVLDNRPIDLSHTSQAFGVNRLITGNVQPFSNGQRVTLTLSDAKTLDPIRSTFVEFNPTSPDSLTDALADALCTLLDEDVSRASRAGIAGPRPASPAALVSYLEGLGHAQERSTAHLEQAEHAFDAAIASDSTFAPAFAARGYVRSMRSGGATTDAALADLQKAVALDSTYVPAWLGIASLYERRGETDLAVQSAERVLQVDPNNVDAYLRLGRTYAMAGRYDEARNKYLEVVRIRPDYYMGFSGLGWVAQQTHASDQEYYAYRRALELAPENLYSLNGMGSYQAQQGNWTAAREYFVRSFLVRPDCSSCSNAGWVLYYENRFADAARYYEYALTYCDSTNYKVWGNLACALYWAEGEREKGIAAYHRAISLAEKTLQDKPDDSETIGRLADYYAMTDDRNNAYRMIERAGDAADADLAYRLACAYEKLGDRERALDSVDRALRDRFPLRQIEVDPLFRDLVRDARFRPLAQAAAAER